MARAASSKWPLHRRRDPGLVGLRGVSVVDRRDGDPLVPQAASMNLAFASAVLVAVDPAAAVDVEAAAGKLPSLRPEADQPESVAVTGTDVRRILRDATQNATADSTDRRKSNTGDGTRTHDLRIMRPPL